MQQGRGGGEGGEMTTSTTAAAASHMGQQPVEAASPISSRPPASNLDELLRLSASGGDDDEGDRTGGVSSGNRWPRQETLALLNIRSDMDAAFRDATVKGPLWEDVSRKLTELGYNRSAKKCKEKFENVHKYYKRTKDSRVGRQDGKSYKFFSQLEALHSSTATTSNVSASLPMPVTTVTNTNTHTITLDVAPVSIGIPMPISSVPIPTSTTSMSSPMFPHNLSATVPAPAAVNVPGSANALAPLPLPTITATATNTPIGINFSSNSSSSSPETDGDDDDDDDDDMGFEGQPLNMAGTSRKRKRESSSSTHRMMEFFEDLMKQVMQKQEAMQQRFLEVIEKREQDRMIREEDLKRQEMARLAREHELMAQERTISASRDAAIISFLQKITGQTIHLPPAVSIPAAPPPAAPPQPQPQAAPQPAVVTPAVPVPVPVPLPLTATTQPHMSPPERRDQQTQRLHHHHRHRQQQQIQTSGEAVSHQPSTVSTSIPSEVVMAIPEQQIPPSHQEIGSSGNLEPASSRWPKVEVLALIKLRSELEHRYQEAGPKGPLWEEISAGMQRMAYNRSAKRCKEKWENINKYFKKVKESNKKRPEDAKTCPYFHELDALYRKKILGSTSGGDGGTSASTSSFTRQNRVEERPQHQQENPVTNPQERIHVSAITPAPQLIQSSESEKKNADSANVQASNVGFPGSLFGEGIGRASKKPEDIMRELMNQQGMQQPRPAPILDDDKIEESNMGSESENIEYEEDEEGDEESEEEEEERKNMTYKVEFQRPNTTATSNGGGNGAPSFLAMVQ